jgi:hypothetical protein
MRIEQYVSAWSNNYRIIFQKSRLISQIPVFILLIIALCEAGDWLIRFSPEEDIPLSRIFEFVLYSLIPIIPLSLRFVLLFSKSKISFWFSQFFWLTIFLWFGYYFTQRQTPPCLRTEEALMFFYLIGSSIRQIITLFLAVPTKATKI